MYNGKDKEVKKELVNTICRELSRCFGEDTDQFGHKVPYSPERGFGAGLMYLPLENLEAMRDCKISDDAKFGDVYQAWGRAGALRFKPYAVRDEDSVSLVLRHNRFLHMFRGYYFQASGTTSGDGDFGHGSYRTDFLTTAGWNCEIINKGLIAYMLWWAAYIDVGFQYRNFQDCFEDDIATVEEFLHNSIRDYYGAFQYHWSDIASMITTSNEPIDSNARRVYQLTDDGKSVLTYLAIGKKTIQVQTAKQTLTLEIPDLLTGSGYSRDKEDDMEAVESEVEILESNHYLEMLAVMLLKLANIHISFINWYSLRPAKETDYMRPINAPDVINVESLNEIYKAVPDEF